MNVQVKAGFHSGEIAGIKWIDFPIIRAIITGKKHLDFRRRRCRPSKNRDNPPGRFLENGVKFFPETVEKVDNRVALQGKIRVVLTFL